MNFENMNPKKTVITALSIKVVVAIIAILNLNYA